MESREWYFVDKSSWGKGAWITEPDKAQWQDEETGMACLAVRHPTAGHWCGYVGIPEGHKLFGKAYDDVGADVHGGLTFSDRCSGNPEGHTVCHVVDDGEPEVFWFGFDCAHLWDISPAREIRERLAGFESEPQSRYRTLPYVKDECHKLAVQLNQLG
jgi:hypothetical protein